MALNLGSKYSDWVRESYLQKHRIARHNWEVTSGVEPSFQDILQSSTQHESPIITASDGGVKVHNNQEHTISAFSCVVLCRPFIMDGESFGDGEWMTRKMIPLLARVSKVPSNIGMNQADSNIVETRSITLREEMLPLNIPSLHIVDSQNVTRVYQECRDSTEMSYR